MRPQCDICANDPLPPYGHRLTCPNCGDTEFFMYRGNIYGYEKEYNLQQEIADCKSCRCSTYTHALKTDYNGEDTGKDFKILWKEKIKKITFVCDEEYCDEQYEDTTRIYEETFYENTEYRDITPEPIDWSCPKHPEAIVHMIFEEVEDINI